MTRVLIMAGGTGGHVFPALAVADALRERSCDIRWLGVPDSFEARVVPQHGIQMEWMDARRLRGQGIAAKLMAPWHLLRAVTQAFAVLRRWRPQVVLGMGGFASGPGGLASRILGVPLVIHEQNAIPGLTNRWLAKLARRVLAAFPKTFAAAREAELVGNPVRADIAALPAPDVRFAARQGPLRLLVLGGSLGAAALNEKVPEALQQLQPALRPEVRHQAGRDKADATNSSYEAAGVTAQVTDFVHDMAEAYAWADLAICRAGAITISELSAVGLGAVLVPYPHAVDDHQTHNARALVDVGAALLLQQADITAAGLAAVLGELTEDRGRVLQMARAARKLARVDAAERVAAICMEVAA